MANYIPFTQDNMFLWYEGNDPDRATPFNGVNLNMPLKQLEQNDEVLDKTINDYAEGNLKANHIKTINLDVDNTLKLNNAFVKNSINDVFFTNKDDENKIVLNSYSLKTSFIDLNGANLKYNTDTFTIEDEDGNLKNAKLNKILVSEINYTDIPSTLKAVKETVGEEEVDYLDFKSEKGYDKSFVRSGAFYALNSYYNFGSNDLQDAIVYDDSNDNNTKNGFLFYADGKVENSTIYTGDVKTVGADIAEFYEADKEYEAGTILEVGGTKEVTLFNGGTLAGVVSKKPGYTLNHSNEFETPVLIALKGRVEVLIDGEAEKGDIIIAYKDGKGKAKKRSKVTSKDQIVGVALETGKNKILIKV
jgi:hypothetical protein